MTSHWPKMNSDKNDFIWLGSKQQLSWFNASASVWTKFTYPFQQKSPVRENH